MTDNELMALMVKVDPLTRRIPEGIRAIAQAIEAAERERCAKLCQQAMPQSVANWNDAQIVEAFRAVLERIRSGA